MGVGIESTERAGGSAAMAAVPSRCARIGSRSLIGSVRWYDSSHPSLADTLKDLGDQAKYRMTPRTAMAAVPSRCARIGGRSLIGRMRWSDSWDRALAETLNELGEQAK